MSTLEIFTSKPPWGILSEKQIFRLVVRQDSRPDRPDEDFGLTDAIWRLLERCWIRDARQRPTFDTIIQLLVGNIRLSTVAPVVRPPEVRVLRLEGAFCAVDCGRLR
ncbi:hypothetical protein C8F01DRAFT_290711 [Mycena amicta]|nr:hypothetical protein C8F01DRAFT_290711 [Mycena amicta]